MPQRADEATPLLGDTGNERHSDSKKPRTPLPWRQFSILLLIQISEPMTSQVISPFLPQLIRDIGVTGGNESRVGYYVGFLHSLFFLTEACTVLHWSRMSDQIGRKPVVMMGLFGLSISMWCFGLSTTFWSLVVSRCLNGALNGNIGVMKSMIAELTDETNVAQAWSILPITWSIGTTVGPLIGGALAEPARRFPELFGDSAFHKKYPYFLPCSVSASVSALSWLIVAMFMKETTNPSVTPRQYFFGRPAKGTVLGTDSGILENCPPPSPEATDKPLPLRSLLVRPVLVAAFSYATFALIDIAFRAVLPVFYAMPIETGGLGLGPPVIGIILAFVGAASGMAQAIFFAPMFDWFGAKATFLACTSLCFPMIALFPVINALARAYGLTYLIWFMVGLQLALFVIANFTFAVTFMCISAAAPNKASIGATNGVAQMAVSVMRAVGPAATTSAFSFSIEEHVLGGNFAYLLMMAMVALTLWVGFLLPRNLQKK